MAKELIETLDMGPVPQNAEAAAYEQTRQEDRDAATGYNGRSREVSLEGWNLICFH
jgi:hypothetical protein